MDVIVSSMEVAAATNVKPIIDSFMYNVSLMVITIQTSKYEQHPI
jgi:hypothetical protein